jgi:integrase
MNIVYKLQGNKAIKKLSVRFYHNRLDLSAVTSVMLMDNEWDADSQSVLNNDAVTIALQELKVDILKRYNMDFCSGTIINKQWLLKIVQTSFMRPKGEEKLISPTHTIYVSDFASFWLDNHANEWVVSNKKFMGEPLQNQYKKFVFILKEYEAEINDRLELRNIKIADLNSFVDYLETENYQMSTIKRQIGRFRFFLNRAVEHNIEVNNSYKQRIYFGEDDEIEGVYLTEVEIQSIVELDLSHDDNLDIAKQNFLIGLHTGLRVSDFLKLDTSNIENGVLKIKTKKTSAKVIIPLHPVVNEILYNNFGNLPAKISSWEFNKSIKIIAQLCKIDSMVYGKLFDKDLKRKKVGYFEKYKLISSHVARRSFATNNYGKVDDATLNSICGWTKNSTMLSHYNKTSKLEHARKLEESWKK